MVAVEHVMVLNPGDVLLGRGTGPNLHPGNRLFRAEISKRKMDYQAATDRDNRVRICYDVISNVHAKGGRFLKKLDSTKKRGESIAIYAVISDPKVVVEKIRQTFRYVKSKKADIVREDGLPLVDSTYSVAGVARGLNIHVLPKPLSATTGLDRIGNVKNFSRARRQNGVARRQNIHILPKPQSATTGSDLLNKGGLLGDLATDPRFGLALPQHQVGSHAAFYRNIEEALLQVRSSSTPLKLRQALSGGHGPLVPPSVASHYEIERLSHGLNSRNDSIVLGPSAMNSTANPDRFTTDPPSAASLLFLASQIFQGSA